MFLDADCEDAVSEAILKAYSSISTLKNEKYFKTWLIRILINESLKIRKYRKANYLYDEQFLWDVEQEGESYTELYNAIISLPEKIRIAVVLYYIEGYSVEEIKDILKVPTGTVKSRLYKGRKMLKIELELKEAVV